MAVVIATKLPQKPCATQQNTRDRKGASWLAASIQRAGMLFQGHIGGSGSLVTLLCFLQFIGTRALHKTSFSTVVIGRQG